MRRCHPLPKLGLALVWIVAAFVVFDPAFLAAMVAAVVALLLLDARVPPRAVLLAAIPFSLFGFGFFVGAVLYRGDGGFFAEFAGETPFRAEAAHAGLTLFLRALAAGMVSFLFAATTDPGDLARALMAARLLPARFGYALFATFNLAPSLPADLRMARLARAMRRGRAPGRFVGPGEVVPLAVALLSGAIRQASDTALAMEARGLGLTRRPRLLNVPRTGVRDLVMVVAGVAALAALPAAAALVGRLLG